MTAIHRSRFPPIGLGLSSVVLGAIGLTFFFVPILGIPVSGVGMAVGLAGIVVAALGGRVSMRLSVAGVLLSGLALGIVAAIAYAPTGYFAPRVVVPILQDVHGRPYVPPPAPPRGQSPVPIPSLFGGAAPAAALCRL